MAGKYEELLARQQAAEKAMKVTPKTGTRELRDTQTSAIRQERSMPSREAMQEAADAAMRRREETAPTTATTMGQGMKKGGKTKCMKKGGSVSSASKRADGIAQRGKTKGKIV